MLFGPIGDVLEQDHRFDMILHNTDIYDTNMIIVDEMINIIVDNINYIIIP